MGEQGSRPGGTVGQTAQVSTVLVVEDERDIRDLLRRYLEREGHVVMTTGSGIEGIGQVEGGGVDLVLLDLGLPDVDGFDVLAAARAHRVAVVALTARNAVEDRIRGLEQGADDYVTKPFSPREVVLRVAAVLARGGSATDEPRESYGDGRLVLDRARHEASWDGGTLELTPTEWGILTALADHPGRVSSRAELVNRARGYEFAGYERTIDSHVKNLRHKLSPDGASVVETVLGVGYRLGLRRDR